MKQTYIVEFGRISEEGALRLPMDRARAFFAQHKGSRVLMRFEVVQAGCTDAQWGYYYGYIVPTIRQALYNLGERKSETEVDVWLCHEYPGADCGMAKELGKNEMSDFIEWLKQFAAENLSVYIEDAKTII